MGHPPERALRGDSSLRPTPDISDDAMRNRESWTQANAEYTDAKAQLRRGRRRRSRGASSGFPRRRLAPSVTCKGLDVVELGCGTAYVSAWLAQRGARPVGVDVTPAQLATARRCQVEFGIEFPLDRGERGERPAPLRRASTSSSPSTAPASGATRTEQDDESGVTQRANIPFFQEMLSRYKNVLKQLQISHSGNNSPLMNLITNSVKSNLDLPGIVATDSATGANIYGSTIKYRWTSVESDNNYDFGLEFEDSKYLEVYMMFKAFDEYALRRRALRSCP